MNIVRKGPSRFLYYIVLVFIGIIMLYPLLWLISASVKTNSEIFGSLSLIPKQFHWEAYKQGWHGSGQYTFGLFFINSFKLVVPTVLFLIVSSVLVGYGFARFDFPLRKVLFMLMIATLILPDTVLIIPRYIMFNYFGWIDSYKPFIVPAIFAGTPFFIFLMVQFIRGIPIELDEAAIVDGCNSFTILIRIHFPISKPAIFSIGIFAFLWTWNEFFQSLVYINSVSKYTVSLGLRMALDQTSGYMEWNRVMAMSVLAILPPTFIFFFAQKYFVEGIATTGLKG